MRTGVVAVLAGPLAAGVLAADAPLPFPREGSGSGVLVVSGAVTVLPLGKDRVQVTYDSMGAIVSDGGQGPFHGASVRCVGGYHAVNGSFDDESGACALTRPDGDQAFWVYKGTGKMGAETKGTSTYVGGTGKLAGIQGSIEWVRVNPRPAAEGTVQAISRWKGTYKLP